ncbi:hypothetical protein FBU30_001295 [Linnemannia zychae]|nr:hypothetical protein FBU30_001295 [Linnemannia zychae]
MKPPQISSTFFFFFATSTLTLNTVQAAEPAFGPHYGLSYVYDIVIASAREATRAMTGHRGYNLTDANYFVRVGSNGIGDNGKPVASNGSTGMDGPFPMFSIFDSMGVIVTKAQKKKPYLESGNYNHEGSKMDVTGATYAKLVITAGDDEEPSPNAVCISSIAVVPDATSTSNQTIAITADLIVSLDNTVPWYYSGRESFAHIPSNDCRPVPIPETCFWMSQFVKKEYTPVYSIELSNISQYLAVLNATGEARLPESGTFKIVRAVREETIPPPPAAKPTPEPVPASAPESAPAPTPAPASESTPAPAPETAPAPVPETAPAPAPGSAPESAPAAVVKRELKMPTYGYAYLGTQSARTLCDSKSSFGPNYLSSAESLYCDLTTRTLYHNCKASEETGCYKIVGGGVTVNDGSGGVASPPIALTLVMFGMPNSDPLATITKRAECIKGTAKNALNVGETLSETNYVSSTEDGSSFRMVVLGSTGDVIVYDASESTEPFSNAVWHLGVHGPRDTYVAEVYKNGQICSRTTAGVVLKCVGPISPVGPNYQLTVSKTGALYIKNGEAVVWTTDPRVTPVPPSINGTVLTESNSFRSLDSIVAPKVFTSTNGNTTLEFKNGSFCLYNSAKVQTWCLHQPDGDNPEVWVTLTTRGSICILRSTNGPLSSRCTGNIGDETSYFAVVSDDGYLKIYNSAHEEMRRYGGEAPLLPAAANQPVVKRFMAREVKSRNENVSTKETMSS